MENPIIGIAVKFQYNIPTLRTLVVMDTISWSSGSIRWSAQKELYFPTKILNLFSLPPFVKMVLKTVQWNVNIIYYFDCCCCCCCCLWWYLLLGLLVLRPSISSLLQSATTVATRCDSSFYYKVYWSVITKCDSVFYYKERQVLLQSATILLQSVIGITKCDRTVYREKYRKISFFILAKKGWVVAVRFFYFGMPVRRLFEDDPMR